MGSLLLSVLMLLGVNLTKSEQYECALPLLIMAEKNVNSENYAVYWYSRAICSHQLMNKDEALSAVNNLEGSFTRIPLRYQAIANIIKDDLDKWEPKGLNDIERRMGNVSRRLKLSLGGPETQRQQKKIVDRLDELIKEQEAKASGQMAKGCPDGGQKPSGGKPNDSVQAEKPAEDSKIMGGKGEGKIDERELKKYAESWGTMPAAARAKVISDLTRQLPPKFEPLIKRYFDQIEKGLHK